MIGLSPIDDVRLLRNRITSIGNNCTAFLALGNPVDRDTLKNFISFMSDKLDGPEGAVAIQAKVVTGDPTLTRTIAILSQQMYNPPANVNAAWTTWKNATGAARTEYINSVVPLMNQTGAFSAGQHVEAQITLPQSFLDALAAVVSASDAWWQQV